MLADVLLPNISISISNRNPVFVGPYLKYIGDDLHDSDTISC